AIGSAALDTLSGIENIRGGRGDDSLQGDGVGNLLFGEGGNDTLDGGAGDDQLTGGSGGDLFIFSTALSVSNVDTILDYRSTDDTILLDDAIFAALGAAGTTLATNAFSTGAAATTSAHRIIYNSDTGALFYDADGSGAGAAVQWATLTGAPLGISNTEFLIF
ncbi:MAG: hypothetical protein ING23_03815, partial [Roseomonas sp.]|nr:hypothetical protein [Roseomonas sp.]